MVHLPASPGQPQATAKPDIKSVITSVVADIKALQDGGIDGLLFCNESDLPYTTKLNSEVGAWTTFLVAGVRVRVGQFSGTVIPGQEMQIDKEAGLVKLTNQRLIFAGSLNTTEWSFAKMLSAARNEEGNDFIIGVSNRKKTSGLKFSASDGKAFARLFALALYAYENGIPETIKEIKSEITRRNKEKPKLELPVSKSKEIEG